MNWLEKSRRVQLYYRALMEDTEDRISLITFPQEYVRQIQQMDQEKIYDFNFIGVIYDETVYHYRNWVIPWVQKNFTDNSYFKIIPTNHNLQEIHRTLGNYDQTFDNKIGYTPKQKEGTDRTYFDANYFQILCRSKFTLCPRGDLPFSIRFFEALLCRSIPIISDPDHAGKTQEELDLKYKYYLLKDQFVYRPEWTEENYCRFIKNHTL